MAVLSDMQVLISGAGIAGLSAAKFLAEAGWVVTVVERATFRRTEGYMLDFFGPGFDAAETMGILPRLRELAYSVDEVEYVNAAGKRTGAISYDRFAATLGGRLLSLMRPDLETAIHDSLPRDVNFRWGTEIDTITQEPDQVTAGLSDGSTVRADLLIGADGIHSSTRAALFGPEEQFLRYLGLHTAAFVIADPGLRADLGRRFLMTDSIGRAMGLYGVRGDDVAVFTVHQAPDAALPADPRAALRRELAGLGALAPRALDRCPPLVYYDAVAQIEMPLWHDGRVVLLGDACQAVSLLAGQGASLAMAGAQLLAEELGQGELSSDELGRALRNYETRWRPVVLDRQAAGRRTAHWFLPRNRVELILRRITLRAIGLPWLNRLFGGALTGKSGPARSTADS